MGGKGPLVRVELEPGRFVKVHKEDAREAGLLKQRRAPGDKMRKPSGDKAQAPAPADFTVIEGVGSATAATIQAQGIRTLEALRTADLGFLSGRAQAAVEAWRDG